MKKEVQEFLEGLDESDIKELQDFIEGRKSKKWIIAHINVLIKGLVFLITSWLIFESFLKHIFTKLFH